MEGAEDFIRPSGRSGRLTGKSLTCIICQKTWRKFPGNLNINVRYSLTDGNELKMEYICFCWSADCGQLHHHSFFNLTGIPKRRSITTSFRFLLIFSHRSTKA
jgi:galactose mutarotase-like enzyme